MFENLIKSILAYFLQSNTPSKEQAINSSLEKFSLLVCFDDDMVAEFNCEDMLGEFAQLKLMFHANFDKPELIPYLGKDFDYFLEPLEPIEGDIDINPNRG